jgi:hypothetical protein
VFKHPESIQQNCFHFFQWRLDRGSFLSILSFLLEHLKWSINILARFCFLNVWISFNFRYKIVLDTDWKEFHGYERNKRDTEFFTTPEPWNNRANSIYVCTFSIFLWEQEENVFLFICFQHIDWLIDWLIAWTLIGIWICIVIFAQSNSTCLCVCGSTQREKTAIIPHSARAFFHGERWNRYIN